MRPSRWWMLALFTIAAGCKDPESPGSGTQPGSMFFNFSRGDIDGTFAVVDGAPSTEWPPTSDWAGADAHPVEHAFSIHAAMVLTSSVYDEVDIYVDRDNSGSATIGGTGGASLEFTITEFGGVDTCILTTGTITLASVTGTRVTGTLSGTGTCTHESGETRAFSITDGTFDVAILSEDNFPD